MDPCRCFIPLKFTFLIVILRQAKHLGIVNRLVPKLCLGTS
jgi:hypothetical protein